MVVVANKTARENLRRMYVTVGPATTSPTAIAKSSAASEVKACMGFIEKTRPTCYKKMPAARRNINDDDGAAGISGAGATAGSTGVGG